MSSGVNLKSSCVPLLINSTEDIEEKEDNFYTKHELTQFLNYLEKGNEPKTYYLFRVLAYTGMRKSEDLGHTWNDINF